MDGQYIAFLCNSLDWDFICYQQSNGLLSYRKIFNGVICRINIYTTKMTVATCLDHPKKGKTQLFRKNVDEEDLRKILKNPRAHTGRGYYTK